MVCPLFQVLLYTTETFINIQLFRFYEEELIEDEEKLEDFKNDRSGEKGNLAKTSQEEIEGLKESGLVVADLVHDFLFVVAHEVSIQQLSSFHVLTRKFI